MAEDPRAARAPSLRAAEVAATAAAEDRAPGAPPSFAGKALVLARRVRFLVACAALGALVTAVSNVGLNLWLSAGLTAVLFLVTGSLWLAWRPLLRHVGVRTVAHATLGAAVVTMSVVSLGEGPTRTPNLHQLALIVVASALLLGVRASRFWTAASLAAAALTFGADVWLGRAPAGLAVNHFMGVATNLVVLHLLASVASRMADTSMAESAQAADRARAAALELEAANAALEAANAALAAAMAARSRFLANMSHEIRTPLNAVLGFTDVLQRTSLDADQRQYTETIRGAGQGLLIVIDDVLDLARIEAGKLDLAREPVDLAEVLATSLDMLAVAAHEKGLELWAESDDGAATHVEADPARLRQVLLNLLGNAVKFTEVGHVVVSLRRSPESGLARLEVTDTGVGIAPGAHEQLFQPFGQEDGSTRRRRGGTGLGLVISKKLIEGMDGHIGFTSEPGKGSCFWIELPAATSPPPAPDRVLRGLKLILVQGRPAFGELLASSLTKHLEQPVALLPPSAGPAELASAIAGAARAIVMVDWDPAAPCPTALLSRLADSAAVTGILLLAPLSEEAGWRSPAWQDRVAVMHKPVPLPRLLQRLADLGAGAPPPLTRPPPPRHFSHRVLLVEDNVVNQMIGRLMLTTAGCTVRVEADGVHAVAAAGEDSFDLVLMDLHMPEMDGLEATQAIRAEERANDRPPVPIIALSASVLSEDRARCLEVGMNGHLAKPISQKALEDLLRSLPVEVRGGADFGPSSRRP